MGEDTGEDEDEEDILKERETLTTILRQEHFETDTDTKYTQTI